MSSSARRVVLPPSLASFFSDSGYCEPTYFEGRKVVRLRIRCEASMVIEESPPSLKRSERNSVVLIKDISRRGISILAPEQLWPEERLFIGFQNREVRAKVVRCRRMAEACWECGAEIESFRHLEDDADL